MLPILLTAREDGLWAEPAAGSQKEQASPGCPPIIPAADAQRVFAPLSRHHWLPPTAPKMAPFYRAAKI